MQHKILITFIFLFSNALFASECWITEDYKGYAAKDYEGFKVTKDGMTSTKYVIVIDGEKSQVLGDPIKFIQVSAHSILGLDASDKGTVVETWSVHPETKTAIYTKTVNDYAMYNGASMFVGKVVGKCNSEKIIK
jgi:hypothetical protein